MCCNEKEDVIFPRNFPIQPINPDKPIKGGTCPICRGDRVVKIIENGIKNIGIEKFCLDRDIVNKTSRLFNIELTHKKIYNQKDSCLCWIYTGIGLIEDNIAENLKVEECNLSANYLSFLDKLEKSNTLYNKIIEKD